MVFFFLGGGGDWILTGLYSKASDERLPWWDITHLLRPLFPETFLIIMEHPYRHQDHVSETHVKLEQEDLSSFEAMVSETFPSS